MHVTTSKGQTLDIDWMWAPVGAAEDMVIQLHSEASLAALAADFEGCESFHRASEEEGDKTWFGYNRLKLVSRPSFAHDPTLAQLVLYRSEEVKP